MDNTIILLGLQSEREILLFRKKDLEEVIKKQTDMLLNDMQVEKLEFYIRDYRKTRMDLYDIDKCIENLRNGGSFMVNRPTTFVA